MVKRFGQEIEIFNEYCKVKDRPKQTTEAAVDIHLDLTSFFAAAIRFFREKSNLLYSNDNISEKDGWRPLFDQYNKNLQSVNETFSRIERLSQLAKQSSALQDFQGQQSLMSLSLGNSKEVATLPCVKLPPAKNSRFYNRDSVCERIDKYFNPAPGDRIFRSLVLYGVGGVGKSHVALKYSHIKATAREVNAVLWIYSETPASLEQSFTDAALLLKLPNVARDRHEEDRILLLHWLQQTDSSWLLVFDNAEDQNLWLKYWPPACSSGSILITSRNHTLHFHSGPADEGLEIESFDPNEGSKMLLHLLKMDVLQGISSVEVQSALELSQHISGHALAIDFMAGLIQERSWSIQEFLIHYETRKSDVHGSKVRNALSTIWHLSFSSLGRDYAKSAALLGIFSYISPDEIPEALLGLVKRSNLIPKVAEALEEGQIHETLQPLLTLSLVKRDKYSKTLSLHRLVQTQHKYYLNKDDRQEAFTTAVQILFDAFPRVESQLYDRWERCQMCLQHILSVKENYKSETKDSTPKRSESTETAAIKAPLIFSWLLRNCSRYLLEIGASVEAEDVAAVALSSYNLLAKDEQNDSVYADILNATALLWAHRGYFKKGEAFLREAYIIRAKPAIKDWLAFSWIVVNLGNVVASTGKYQEALELELQGEQTMRIISETPEAANASAIVTQNIGRCHMFLGNFIEAHERLQHAMEVFSRRQNWAMVAFTLFAQGCLERKENNYEAAKMSFANAQQTWLKGGKMRTHHFNGACVYKLGCVEYDRGNIQKSIDHLREALVITKMKKEVMAGEYARVLHKLSVVLAKSTAGEVEASEKNTEALQILFSRKLNTTNSSQSEDEWSIISKASSVITDVSSVDQKRDYEGERPYDELVYILWR